MTSRKTEKTTEAPKKAPRTSKMRKFIETYLSNTFVTTLDKAAPEQLYQAAAKYVNMQLNEKRVKFNEQRRQIERESEGRKKIYYISMEFLLGRSLKNNLYNLGETEEFESIARDAGYDAERVFESEPDAGLGNGGLGRLAACFMDAMATGSYDVTGYSLCYEYGLFKQKIIDGWQTELPDNWLPGGRVWLNERTDDTFKVSFYGNYNEYWEDGRLKYSTDGAQTVEAVPYDIFISGANSKAVAKLRLWAARGYESFDMGLFNNGDFTRAAQKANSAELITKVLYPADNIQDGKELRLKQQYLMVSASAQNIVRDYARMYGSLDDFEKRTVVHINDTHPALVIPELMRIFIDDYGLSWDEAWKHVTGAVSYTNHTVLAEALEKWNCDFVRDMMPRVYAIIKEIDRRFRLEADKKFPGDMAKINYMAPLEGNLVKMANLSVIGSHKVNGVSKLHSEILKDQLFHDFYLMTPEKFTNVTNGIAYRRWLCQADPELAKLIDGCIGTGYRTKGGELSKFIKFESDTAVLDEIDKIKRNNKIRLINMIKDQGYDIIPDPDSIFIVQAKRMHEYKRQLMNALRIISRYIEIKEDPDSVTRPETYIFAAKAAPSYYLAKFIIQLIAELSAEIAKDPVVSKKLKVIFLENYSVSMAETLMPASDISEQISLAGKEASGTGNMKMMINGALTVGTLDGANVEMREAVGPDNIYIFGQTAEEVIQHLQEGYDAKKIYESDDLLKASVDMLSKGFNGVSFQNLKDYLLQPSYSIADPYMCLYDFADYRRVHAAAQSDYEDRHSWNSKAVANIAMASRFSADRSIADYAEKVWDTKPVFGK
jgi:starch phosphorylase